MPYYTQGNTDILKLHKTDFLCFRKCPADIVLKSYDRAIEDYNKIIQLDPNATQAYYHRGLLMRD
ncbi:MAG: tetratricopeptide repeat protein [Deltaproteobacteria bacterium]|nr:tetratricopeptide repeat protein [Deltaproteobacteria bacterium]